VSTTYNIFYCDKFISGYIIRKLSRIRKYHVLEFNDYEDFINFINNNINTSLFGKKYYIFLLTDLIITDKELFLTHELADHVIITNNFTNLRNSKPLNLLAKTLSKNNSSKLIIFLVNKSNILYTEGLLEIDNMDINQLCSILEYMDITDSELPFDFYISAGSAKYNSEIGRVLEIIEEGEKDNLNKLATIHPGAISLYLQRKLISKLKDGNNKELNYKKLISLYENDKFVKLYSNEANFLLKHSFQRDKTS
jgi:hypothetical protein